MGFGNGFGDVRLANDLANGHLAPVIRRTVPVVRGDRACYPELADAIDAKQSSRLGSS